LPAAFQVDLIRVKKSICQIQKRQKCSGEICNDRSLTGEM